MNDPKSQVFKGSLIKRYPNRKLYDTRLKEYITLEQVADIVRNGGEIKVVDHVNGNDLTALILAQIIYEQEKKRSGFLPVFLLSAIVRAGDDFLEILNNQGFASRSDYEQLLAQVEFLTDQVDQLTQKNNS